MSAPLGIAVFTPSDQDEVRRLILDGLEERWGSIDATLNPDLDDIATAYVDGTVLVARVGDRVVGAGVLVPLAPGEGEVKRMSVARELRRTGVGTALLHELVAVAERNGWGVVRLETTATWTEAVRFYEDFGSEVTHDEDGPFGRDIYFKMELPCGT